MRAAVALAARFAQPLPFLQECAKLNSYRNRQQLG